MGNNVGQRRMASHHLPWWSGRCALDARATHLHRSKGIWWSALRRTSCRRRAFFRCATSPLGSRPFHSHRLCGESATAPWGWFSIALDALNTKRNVKDNTTIAAPSVVKSDNLAIPAAIRFFRKLFVFQSVRRWLQLVLVCSSFRGNFFVR